jgi:hypothetical protein
MKKPLTAAERRDAVDTMVELAERRAAGAIPFKRSERHRSEGWWGFLHLLRAFAQANALPQPAIDHRLGAYAEQVARDVMARHRWFPPDGAGAPLSAWPAPNRATLTDVWRSSRVVRAGIARHG